MRSARSVQSDRLAFCLVRSCTFGLELAPPTAAEPAARKCRCRAGCWRSSAAAAATKFVRFDGTKIGSRMVLAGAPRPKSMDYRAIATIVGSSECKQWYGKLILLK